MNTKHTPGPWRVSTSNRYAVNDFGRGIATTHGTDDANYSEFFPSTEEAAANARLIAAAPELLEALNGFEPVDVVNFARWMERYQVAMNNARAAIAKATGNTL